MNEFCRNFDLLVVQHLSSLKRWLTSELICNFLLRSSVFNSQEGGDNPYKKKEIHHWQEYVKMSRVKTCQSFHNISSCILTPLETYFIRLEMTFLPFWTYCLVYHTWHFIFHLLAMFWRSAAILICHFVTGLVTNSILILFCWLFTITDCVEKCIFNKRTIKVCVSCWCPWCPGTPTPSSAYLTVSLYLCSSGSNARGKSRVIEGRRVIYKSPSRIRDGDEGVTERNGREKCFPNMSHWFFFTKKGNRKNWVSGQTWCDPPPGRGPSGGR